MSQTDPAHESPSPRLTVVSPEELAARLAAKLCHDFISPAGAIVSGLDLLDDPTAKDMRDEAMDLIAASAKKLTDHLAFARVAFGTSAGSDSFDSAELQRLTQGVFNHVRAELDWALAPQTLPKRASQVLINLAQLAAQALPMGGVARAEVDSRDGARHLVVRASGARARLHAEVKSGLEGEGLGDGLAGRWVQAYYVQAIARAGGGEVAVEAGEEMVVFRATIPAAE
ncbi:MAG TPA: histidine phosphotransferase family protein [Caulobacteraceae bacterium]|nr:histidine phosphotransferase family protein [Caulobacteraceae bacterium]